MSIKIDTSEVTAALANCENELNDIPWSTIAINVQNSIMDNFQSGGRYSSKNSPIGGTNKWTPRKVDQPWPTLIKSGKLMMSNYATALTNGIELGSRGVKYNAAQNFGYKSIKARPFLVIQKEDLKEIADTISNIIASIFK